MTKKICLIILGTQPAVLSEVSQNLGREGLKLPSCARNPGRESDLGHWESERLLGINSKLLNWLNRAEDDWRPLLLEDIPTDVRQQCEDEIQAAIVEEYADARAIVLTIPRLYRFLGLYQNALRGLSYKTVFIHLTPKRVPKIDPSMSAAARAHNKLLLVRNMLSSEAATRGEKRVFLACNVDPDRNSLLVGSITEAFPEVLSEEEVKTPDQDHIQSGQDSASCKSILAEITEGSDIVSDIHAAMRFLEKDAANSTVQGYLDRRSKDLDEIAVILGDTYFEDAEHLGDDGDKTQFMLQETAPSIEHMNESFQAAVKFLRKPHINALRHPLARVFSRFPAFSLERRARLKRSAAKTDHRKLVEQLSDINLVQPNDLIAGAGGATRTDSNAFINSLVPARSKTLMSNWHVALHIAIVAPDVARLPSLTISFVTFNSARWLDEFFTSLKQQNYPLAKLTVIFVDHGSEDETLSKIAKFIKKNEQDFARIVVFERENNGFGAGHDFAIRQSQDDFVLVSNVDLNFHDDTLTALVAAATVDEEDIASWEVRQCPYEHPKFYDPVTLETSWSSHACILIRRSAYFRVGGYENRIFMYGEDVELSYRFRGAGYRLRYLPQITVTHFVSFSEPELRPHQLGGSLSANVLLRHRYGGKIAGQIGEKMLQDAFSVTTNATEKSAFELAVKKIESDKQHFATVRTPEREAYFPFNGFDYDLARIGHDIEIRSNESLVHNPLVTVITRTHGPNTSILKEAIVSVLNQSYRNIEYVVVEDRTDFAGKLITEVKEAYGANIRYIKSEKTGGAGRSNAGNAGLAAAQGDLLMFLDNDDLLFADHVELLVRRLMDQPAAVASYSLAWDVPSVYSANGSYHEGVPNIPNSHRHPYNRRRFHKANFIPIQSILFKRVLYEDHGGFDPSIDHLEDWNLWVRYSKSGDFEFVPKITSFYRTPGDLRLRRKRQEIMLAAEPNVYKKNFGES